MPPYGAITDSYQRCHRVGFLRSFLQSTGSGARSRTVLLSITLMSRMKTYRSRTPQASRSIVYTDSQPVQQQTNLKASICSSMIYRMSVRVTIPIFPRSCMRWKLPVTMESSLSLQIDRIRLRAMPWRDRYWCMGANRLLVYIRCPSVMD